MPKLHRNTISTVIPVYLDSGINPNLLIRCLDSISYQKIQPNQIIITDNSSDLAGLMHCRKYYREKKFKFELLLIDGREHLGISKNTNFGLKFATQDIYHVMHSDDYLSSVDFYREALIAFDSNPHIVWGFSYREIKGRNLEPVWTSDCIFGFNRLGGPSTLVARNYAYPNYQEALKYFLDVEAYSRIFALYGPPLILANCLVAINTDGPRESNTLSTTIKIRELAKILSKFKLSKKDHNRTILQNIDLPNAVQIYLQAMRLQNEKIPLLCLLFEKSISTLKRSSISDRNRTLRKMQYLLSRYINYFVGNR
jgi:glycosyltransferase involved in cell wall biosynthesis